MFIWIELGVALAIAMMVWLSSLSFKPEHVEHHPTRVRIGAFLHGLILGGLVGFVILPLRLAFFVPDPDLVPDAPHLPARGHLASMALIPVFLFLVVVRRGLLARAPVIGLYLRAYRRAGLLQQIDQSRKALARLEAMDQ